MNTHVLLAIFKRNIVSYFSNPTGYVFVCAFVTAASFATFVPPEFFSSNLANLDQLTAWLPFILLGFIPAITMSIWAEERRQGTDELLLTIPATDLDVVLGKFLAAVMTYSISLGFSMIVNMILLMMLGSPDLGLYFGTYMGYWFVGVCMLSVGMVASFLTSNLTVGFILGALFNIPLVLSAQAATILPPGIAKHVMQWSVTEKFRIFERGVISLAGISYFVLITVVMLYLSIVLIGRRHWMGGRDGSSMIGHYAARTIALFALAIGSVYFLYHHDSLRYDMTSEKLSSLSPHTVEIIQNLPDDTQPIVIEAYISPDVPAEFAEMKRNLESTLDEMSALSNDKIIVQKNLIEGSSEEAALAERKHGIRAEPVESTQRGVRHLEDIYMGLVFTCGLETVRLPFINKGVPIEYELVRSISTVAQQKRKRVGVIKTKVSLSGGFDMATMSQSRETELIRELNKQYDVDEVDPSQPITEDYDVLLAVQPSSLDPQGMKNFIAAVKRGLPTAIFEDPLPLGPWGVLGTDQREDPRRGRRPTPKGNIQELWELLGVDFIGDQIVIEAHNPYPKIAELPSEYIFLREGVGRFDDKNAITSGLHEVLFLGAGSWREAPNAKTEFVELASTGKECRIINSREYRFLGQPRHTPEYVGGADRQIVAAYVYGAIANDSTKKSLGSEKDSNADSASGESKETELSVVLVSDIDCMIDQIFQIRQFGSNATEASGIEWEFQNVSFVLNVIDVLAHEERPFVDIRKRRRIHRKLDKLDTTRIAAEEKASAERKIFQEKFTEAIAEETARRDAALLALTKKKDQMTPQEYQQHYDIQKIAANQRLEFREADIKREQVKKIKEINRQRDDEIRDEQDWFKVWAFLIPPILPFVMGCFVFFHRRNMESEGVAKERLR